MKCIVRKTEESEFYQTENITREAFWNVYQPGCSEHLVLNKLRSGDSYMEELDLVAMLNNVMAGHIISSKAKVIDHLNNEYAVLCVGPLSVLPEYQKNGIGSALIYQSIKVARKLDYFGLILFGNPDYYHRFGFKNAKIYQITTKDNQNVESFMALELHENSLNSVSGRFFEDEGFLIDEEELIEFEKQFPSKERMVTKTQLKH